MSKQSFTTLILLFTVILMDLLTGMEFDLFVPSFPELQNQFNLNAFWTEALLSVNFVGYCLSILMVGSLADRYGRKPILLGGLFTFVIGSTLCLFALSYKMILLGRLLQGIGIASPSILSFLIIADSYPIQKQQFYIAMLNGIKNTSVAISPVIGSYLTLNFHWQGNFAALFVLGFITFIMAFIFVPNYKLVPQSRDPLFSGYLRLFRLKPLLLLMSHIILMFMPYWIFVGMSPILYMKDLGVTLAHFGYYQGVLALTFALVSVWFGFKIERYSSAKIFNVAGILYIASLISILLVTFFAYANPLVITLGFLPFIISQVIPSTLLVPICLNFFPEAKAKISAVLQGGQLLLVSCSLQVAGYYYQGSFQSIGIIVSTVILLILFTHYFVQKYCLATNLSIDVKPP